MWKKIIIILVFIIIMNIILFSKEVLLSNKDNDFKLNYDDTNITTDSNDPNKFTIQLWDYIDLNDKQSSVIIFSKDQLLEKEKMIESGKYSPIEFDLLKGYPLSYKVIKTKKNKNFLYYIYLDYSKKMDKKIYVGGINGRIDFFKENKYFEIRFRYHNLPIYNAFINKSNDYYNYFFKEYKRGYGLVFQSDDKAKELYEAIVKKDKRLPEDLISWYENFMKIVNSFEIE